eukprot:TRINITY_DN4284_c0_g1_i1.p1 TRINITY_DN4284_c0_g1~~TRINITY_DN4284_c0_g1_i1.p1  ORF type:complete len:255 (-),score=32.83 TRINITY_DN4284_c0_g1_i1:52-816(-)
MCGNNKTNYPIKMHRQNQSTTWSCAKCTFINASTKSKCDACGNQKPTPTQKKMNLSMDTIPKRKIKERIICSIKDPKDPEHFRKVNEVRCNQGHIAQLSTYSGGVYSNGWICTLCKSHRKGRRWFCSTCGYDQCEKCPTTTQVRIKVANKNGISIRKHPIYPGERVGINVKKNEIISYNEKKKFRYRSYSITFYKLSDGRGWIHNFNPRAPNALDGIIEDKNMTFREDELVLAKWSDGYNYEAKIICSTEKRKK